MLRILKSFRKYETHVLRNVKYKLIYTPVDQWTLVGARSSISVSELYILSNVMHSEHGSPKIILHVYKIYYMYLKYIY